MNDIPTPPLTGNTLTARRIRAAMGPGYLAPVLGEDLLRNVVNSTMDPAANHASTSPAIQGSEAIPPRRIRLQLLRALAGGEPPEVPRSARSADQPTDTVTDDVREDGCQPVDVEAGLCVHNESLSACPHVVPAELAAATTADARG